MQKDSLESQVRNMQPSTVWYKVFIRKYGAKAVVSDDSELRGKVAYEGGKMVKFQNKEITNMLTSIGALLAETFIEEKMEERRETEFKYFDDVSKKKQRNIKIAFGIIQKTGMFKSTFKDMVQEGRLRFFNSTLNDGRSFGQLGGDKISLPLSIIHDPVRLVKSIGHELIHNEFDCDDLSEEMQAYTGHFIMKLTTVLLVYLSPKTLIDSV